MLEREKYRFEYDDIDWTQIKEAFPVKSVLEDYMGVSVKGNRCACPIHGGKKLSMQVFDTTAKCYSECQESFSAFDLVKHNDNLSSTYDAILHLCDFYNVDPLSFDGIKPANGNDNTKRTPTRKNPIPLSKAQLDFMNLKVNPFTRHTVQIKTGEKTHTNARGQVVATPILSKQYLSDQECAWIMMHGVKNLAKNANTILYNVRQYLYTIQMKKTDGEMIIKNIKDCISWYNNVVGALNTIGIKEPEYKEEVLSQYFSEQPSFYAEYPETNTEALDRLMIESTEHLCQESEITSVELHMKENMEKKIPGAEEYIEKFLQTLGIQDTLPKMGQVLDEYDNPIVLYANKNEYLLNVKERLIRHELQTEWIRKAAEIIESVAISKPELDRTSEGSLFATLSWQETLVKQAKEIVTEEYSKPQEMVLPELEEEIER